MEGTETETESAFCLDFSLQEGGEEDDEYGVALAVAFVDEEKADA